MENNIESFLGMEVNQNVILNLYPTTKFLFVICVTLGSFFSDTYLYGYILAAVLVLISIVAGKFKEFLPALIKLFLVFVLFILLLRGVFHDSQEVLFSIGFLKFKTQGIIEGLKMTSIIISFAGSLLLFFKVTSIGDFMIALEKLGLSSMATYVVLSTFQTIPDLKERSNTIMASQKARGIETEGNIFIRMKAFVPIIGPLLLSAIADTEEKAIALESRAFTSEVKRTNLVEVEDSGKDKFLRIFMILITVIFILRRIVLWML